MKNKNFKKIILGFLAIVLITSGYYLFKNTDNINKSSNVKNNSIENKKNTELEDLPKDYTLEMARANKDCFYDGENNNIERFYKFMDNAKNGIKDKIRICSFYTFQEKQDTIIIELTYNSDKLSLKIDETRRVNSSPIRHYKIDEIYKSTKPGVECYIAKTDEGKKISLITNS